MDPNALKFGSGSPLLGGSSAINEAIARRGQGASAMSAVGGSAPTAQAMPMPPQGSAMPPQPEGMPAPVPTPSQGLPQGKADSEIILEALSNRLKSDSKIKESQNIPPTPAPTPTISENLGF